MLVVLKKKDFVFFLIYQDIVFFYDESKYLFVLVVGFVQSCYGNYLLLMNKECLCVGVLLFNGGEIVYLSVDVVMIKYYDILINYLLDFK